MEIHAAAAHHKFGEIFEDILARYAVMTLRDDGKELGLRTDGALDGLPVSLKLIFLPVICQVADFKEQIHRRMSGIGGRRGI